MDGPPMEKKLRESKGAAMKLADDIYVYEWTHYYDNNCNSFYIGGNVNALIDPGLKAYLPNLLESMEDEGIAREDIRYIINTHSHPDHFEGSELFNNSEVQIAMHEEEIAFMNGLGARIYFLFGMAPPDVRITMRLQTGVIILGDETFEILHIPGHSPGSLGLYWPARKALFSGDVIFSQNVGRTDFPGGSGSLLKKSIRALAERDIDTLFPGHMEIVNGPERVKSNFQVVMQNVFPYI
jgi:glyoxylase-like metal-dependent hydrolase (beta-lactamase superfamily II)